MIAMTTELDPVVGNWYRHLDKGQMFRVIDYDDSEAIVEIQHFDGDIEELSVLAWRSMDLEVSEAPGDWTGPMDFGERDDLGYSSETEMSNQDWRSPLQETLCDEHETWEDTGERGNTGNRDNRPSADETWEPDDGKDIDADVTSWPE